MATLKTYFRNLKVAIHRGPAEYPGSAPYDPSVRYPEYHGTLSVSAQPNIVYEGVRSLFLQLGLDKDHAGKKSWNPLGDIISPGQTVVIKPNFVLSDHYRGGELFSVITHPSLLRTMVDYAYKALRGKGKLIIADTPQMDCDFEELLTRTQLLSVQELYRAVFAFEIPVLDLRNFWFKYKDENYVASQSNRHPLPGDPNGSALVDLGRRSAFSTVAGKRYYGADYNRAETDRHHSDGRHEYMVSKTILGADVILSVPKLKVHKKVGVTLNAKGLVGTVTNKNFLIHFSVGSTGEGGDQYPAQSFTAMERGIVRIQRFLNDTLLSKKNRIGNLLFQLFYAPYRILIKPLFADSNKKILTFDGGNWHGNDSAWRMVSDLMKISIYADKEGTLKETPQRKFFSVIDGIVGGEGNGPLFPDARKEGILVGGTNPLAVDISAARLMGMDWRKIAWMKDLLSNKDFSFGVTDPTKIKVVSSAPEYKDLFRSPSRFLAFKPHPGWVGNLEIDSESSSF